MAFYQQGLYECLICGQGFDESKEKKTPYFWLKFQPFRCDGVDVSGMYDREVLLYLTDATIERAVEHLRRLGWEGSDWAELEPQGSCSFEGRTVTLRCMHEQAGDKVYEKWEFPLGSVTNSQHKSGISRKLNALFGKNVKNGQKKQSNKKAAEAAAVADSTEEDDIPF